ncbi:hypothetical protein Tco_0227140, partial [Tanacetum coccineum]
PVWGCDTGLRFEIKDSSSAPTARPTGGFRRDYGFVATLDDEIRRDRDREIELGQRMTNFVTTVRQDTDEIYRRLDEAQDARLSMDANDMAYSKVRALQTTVLAQQTEIGDLRAAERRRQTQLREALTMLKTLQTQMLALQSQQRPARDPAHPDVPKEAGSSS